MKALYKYKKSGDIFAIETDKDGTILSTCGPLLTKDLDPENLDYDEYWNNDVQANLDSFEKLSKLQYREILQKNGFNIQSSQKSLFDSNK